MLYPTKKLGEICIIERGGSPRPIESFITNDENGINWIKIGDTKNISKYIEKTSEKIKPEGVKRSRMVYPGDFILSNSMSFGKPFIMKTTGCIHDGWLVLRTDKNVIDDNLLYLLLSSDFMYSKFSNASSGTTVKNLSIDKVKNIEIPLPPLPTQKLIVKKLDSAFENIDKSINLIKENLKNLEELNKSVLEKVFSEGEYEIKKMGDLYDITSSKRVFQSEWKKEGIPFYRAREIVKLAQNGYVDNDLYISNEMYQEYSVKYGIPKKGDIMITGVGTLGICYVVNENDKFYFKDGNIIWFKNNDLGVNSYFIEYGFKSRYIRSQIDNTSGSVVGTYTIQNAKNTKIPLPPLEKQKEIVEYLDQVFEKNKNIKTKYENQLNELEELKQSLLKDAFEGKLVKE